MAKGIYKRGNVYWIRYAGLDGKTVYESSGSEKFKDAEALLIQRKGLIKEGKQPDIKRIDKHTFRELKEKYAQWMEGRHRSADTKKYRLESMLNHFGDLPLQKFNTLIIEQYQSELINRGLKPASVNKNIGILKAMIKKAVDWNMAPEETLKLAGKVKPLSENNRRLRYLSKEECQSLIEACKPHLKPIVITALNTGMRRGEILGLKWEQVDLRNGFILLDITKNGERREIPINQTLTQTLKGVMRKINSPYVFVDKDGKEYKEVKKSFNTALTKAKIKDFRFHDLRHTFASHMVMAGVDITTVKELLGHKSLTMTLRYAHLAPSHKVKAVDVLDSTLNKTSTIQKLYNQPSTTTSNLELTA